MLWVGYCKTGAYDICMNFSRFFSLVYLMMFMNIKFQLDFTMEKNRT